MRFAVLAVAIGLGLSGCGGGQRYKLENPETGTKTGAWETPYIAGLSVRARHEQWTRDGLRQTFSDAKSRGLLTDFTQGNNWIRGTFATGKYSEIEIWTRWQSKTHDEPEPGPTYDVGFLKLRTPEPYERKTFKGFLVHGELADEPPRYYVDGLSKGRAIVGAGGKVTHVVVKGPWELKPISVEKFLAKDFKDFKGQDAGWLVTAEGLKKTVDDDIKKGNGPQRLAELEARGLFAVPAEVATTFNKAYFEAKLDKLKAPDAGAPEAAEAKD